jgi:hypothetical protein
VSASSLAFPFDRPETAGAIDRLLAPLALLGAQLAYSAPALVLVLASWAGKAGGLKGREMLLLPAAPFDRSLLLITFFLPLLAAGLSVGVAGRWGRVEALGSMFIALGPAMLALASPMRLVAVNRLAIAVAAVIVVAPPVMSGFYGPLRQLFGDAQHGGEGDREAAARIAAEWEALAGRPLSLIVATFTDGGKISTALTQQPSVMIDGRFDRAPWVTPDRIDREGALVLWRAGRVEDCVALPPELVREIGGPLVALDPVPGAGSVFCRAAILPGQASAASIPLLAWARESR